ncbi:MAG: hypothetical protein RLY16_97 [Bacteroidota bacterium]
MVNSEEGNTRDLLHLHPEGKVFPVMTIIIATFLCGLPAGGYMLYKNFLVFQDTRKAQLTIAGTLGLLLLLIGSQFVPVLSRLPNVLFMVFFTIAVSFIGQHYQAQLVDRHLANGGKRHSVAFALVISILSVLLVYAIFLLLYFAVQDQVDERIVPRL